MLQGCGWSCCRGTASHCTSGGRCCPPGPACTGTVSETGPVLSTCHNLGNGHATQRDRPSFGLSLHRWPSGYTTLLLVMARTCFAPQTWVCKARARVQESKIQAGPSPLCCMCCDVCRQAES